MSMRIKSFRPTAPVFSQPCYSHNLSGRNLGIPPIHLERNFPELGLRVTTYPGGCGCCEDRTYMLWIKVSPEYQKGNGIVVTADAYPLQEYLDTYQIAAYDKRDRLQAAQESAQFYQSMEGNISVSLDMTNEPNAAEKAQTIHNFVCDLIEAGVSLVKVNKVARSYWLTEGKSIILDPLQGDPAARPVVEKYTGILAPKTKGIAVKDFPLLPISSHEEL